MKHGRKKPYTEIGIKRLPCYRCGSKPSKYQWNICSDDNLYHPLCEKCDIELNKQTLIFMNFDDWQDKINDYEKSIIEEYK